MRIKLNGEVRMQIFLITITILILITVYGIKRQKEIQQFKQNLEMNIDKPRITGTCEICGRKGVELGFYGKHVLCDSCYADFQEYMYQLWREHKLKDEQNRGGKK